jgi:hypothetical protein
MIAYNVYYRKVKRRNKMKKIKLFILPLLLILGACKQNPVEPIIPPESIVITSVTIEVTATTAVLKTTVTTSKTITMTVEYGVGNYTSTTNANPSSINGNMSVSARLSGLTPNTTYKYRIKAIGNTTSYFNDSTFTTSSQLQIGDVYQEWTIFSVNPLLGFKIVNEYQNWETAKATALAMGGYLPSIAQQLILFSLKEKFGLTEFTYWSSEEDKDEPGLVVTVIFNNPSNPGLNGQLVSNLKTFIFKSLVVHQF